MIVIVNSTYTHRGSYALYSSFSPGFQKYLDGLYAVHSAVAQADGNRAAGLPVRREPVESVHPIVRVHPVTGWKSVYVNPGTFLHRTHKLNITMLITWHRFYSSNRRCPQVRIRRYPQAFVPTNFGEP